MTEILFARLEDVDAEAAIAAKEAAEAAADAAAASAAEIESLTLYFRLMVFIAHGPLSGELCVRYVFTDTIEFAEDMPDSEGRAISAPTGDVQFSIQKNGVEVFTAAFAMGDTTATFHGSATTFNDGDILSIVGPDPRDATLEDISLTLAGLRPV